MDLFDKYKGKMFSSDEYLTKPFDPCDLVIKIGKFLPR
jgi:DNA-binding response OmpR family regulator